jgi:hypothetical protein
MELINNKLVPASGKHLKNKDSQIFESAIWLGIYDSKDNYVEVSEEEYQKWLEEQQDEL